MVTKYFFACIELLGAFLCFISSLYLNITKSINREQNKALAATELIVGIMLLFDGLAWVYRGEPGRGVFIALNVFNYVTIACNAIMPAMFGSYIIRSIRKDARNFKVLYLVCVLSALLELFLLLSYYRGYIFRINPETNTYQRGPGFIVWSVLNIVSLVILVTYSIIKRKYMNKGRLIAILLFALLPVLTAAIQTYVYGLSLSNLAILLCALIMWYQSVHDNVKGMLEYQNQLRMQEIELDEMRNRIALSQIRPHFLYNILNSIYVLCDEDKEQAKVVVNNLADYLRGNLGSIESKEPIPFEKELEHTKIFIELEKVRFNDRFVVHYDINATDFVIPALTVQPMVENAIKHGLCKKKLGEEGVLLISSYDKGDYYSVCVEDNGVGFDVDAYYRQDVVPGQHIGLRNVKNRIKIIENADLIVTSRIGGGTKVEIRIPKQTKKCSF